MTRPRILLDCDPGIDDAFAIFCALRYADLAAVTTVAGNVTLAHTTRNARFLLELAGASAISVHRGAEAPLSAEPLSASRIHGTSGLGGLHPPEPENPPSSEPAHEAMLRHSSDVPVTIVATGPLTNLAVSIESDPGFVDRIERVYWMGGSTTDGNVTEFAEFNAWADPEAADRVFRSGVAITMFGLNVTRQVRMTGRHSDELRRAATTTSVPAADFLDHYERNAAEPGAGQPMHDPCAVLGVTDPDLFVFEEANSLVVTTGDMRGRTLITDEPSTDTTPIVVATRADAARVVRAIMHATVDPRATS